MRPCVHRIWVYCPPEVNPYPCLYTMKTIRDSGSANNATAKPINDLLTPKDASSLLHVHVISLRRYRAQGKLKAYRLPGGGIRYRRDDLLKLLEQTKA